MKIKITIGKGIKFKRESKPFKTLSIGAESFLKSGRWVNNHSLIFTSIHSDIGMYKSKSDELTSNSLIFFNLTSY